jgi:hypothetical protein
MDIELISILANATEKTQKPFLERGLNLYRRIHDKPNDEDVLEHFKNSLKDQLKKTYKMNLKEKAFDILDKFEQIFDQPNISRLLRH